MKNRNAKITPDEDDGIPAFLLVKNRPNRQPRNGVEVTDAPAPPRVGPVEVALAKIEPAEFREYVERSIRRGHFNSDWLLVNEPRRTLKHIEETLSVFRLKHAEDVEKKERNKERLKELRERAPKRINPLAGLVPLRVILAQMGDDAPSRGQAKAAVDAANLEHTQYHFASGDVTIAHVRRVLKAYKPPPKTARGNKPTYPADARITFAGKKNPKKEGTGAHARWALLIAHSGKMVGAFLEAGGNPTTLRNALSSKRASLSGGTLPAADAAPGTDSAALLASQTDTADDGVRASGKKTASKRAKAKKAKSRKKRR